MTKAMSTCRAPLDWETPTGKTAKVNLELQLSAFFGYGKNDTDSYLGLQAHGVLWVADPTQAPVNWPIAPPIVAGKVGAPLPAGRGAVAPCYWGSFGQTQDGRECAFRYDGKFLGQLQPEARPGRECALISGRHAFRLDLPQCPSIDTCEGPVRNGRHKDAGALG